MSTNYNLGPITPFGVAKANGYTGTKAAYNEALANLIDGGGGSGGTTDYADLTNKPSINGVTLSGNKTTDDLGITSAPMTEITYDALKTLRNGDDLVPGMQYRITDYETIINGSYNLSTLGAQGYLHYAVSAGHPFDLIVVADDESHLNENARAALHEGDTYFANSNLGAWRLKYKLDNDSTKYTWASSSGKGIIIWMEDEFNNRAGYDFKNIQFVRYALKLADATADHTPVDTGLVYDIGYQPNRYGSMYNIFMALQAYMETGSYVNPFTKDDGNVDYDFAAGANILGTIQMASIDATYKQAFYADCYYTFDYWNGIEHIDASLNSISKIPCRENYIEIETDPVAAAIMGVYVLYGLGGSVWETNSVFIDNLPDSEWNSISENHLGLHSWCNTFGNYCNSNIFGNNCYSNIFGNYCYSNTFGNVCRNNTFGDSCGRNTFGESCYKNTFLSGCDSNIFGNSCSNNTFGQTCRNNTFGNSCGSNFFGDSCSNNTFGNSCGSNFFGDSCSNNTFGNYCGSNFFVGFMSNLQCNGNVHTITATTSQYGTDSPAIKTLENYDGATRHATLYVKSGPNNITAMSTTNGSTWTPESISANGVSF